MRLTLHEMSVATHAELTDPGDSGNRVFERLSTDTRTLQAGDVFLALRGDNFNGHDFIEQALQKGAGCLVVSETSAGFKAPIPILKVTDTLQALGDLAQAWRKRFTIPVVAIAGSNGKTTTRAVTGNLLASSFRLHQTKGNFNNLIGLPLTILELKPEHDVMLLELGMNALGEVKRLAEIAQPTVGLITNIGPEHLEFLKNLDTVAQAEGELFAALPANALAIVNNDDPYCPGLAEKAKISPERRRTFGWKTPAQFSVEKVERLGAEGSRVTIRHQFHGSGKSWILEFPLPGDHNVYNLVAAVAVATSIGVPAGRMQNAVRTLKPVGSRTRMIALPQGGVLIDDCYNANPASMKAALHLLQNIEGLDQRTAVLGEMLELGDSTVSSHREAGREAVLAGVGLLCIAGEHAYELAQGAEEKGLHPQAIRAYHAKQTGKPSDDDIEKIVKTLVDSYKPRTGILIKGSRGMALERVVEKFCKTMGIELTKEGH